MPVEDQNLFLTSDSNWFSILFLKKNQSMGSEIQGEKWENNPLVSSLYRSRVGLASPCGRILFGVTDQ